MKNKQAYMDTAIRWAQESYCKRLQVGCIIVKDRRIISIGYNGMPNEWENQCEVEVDGQLVSKPQVLHAEANAIAKLARSPESSEGAALATQFIMPVGPFFSHHLRMDPIVFDIELRVPIASPGPRPAVWSLAIFREGRSRGRSIADPTTGSAPRGSSSRAGSRAAD